MNESLQISTGKRPIMSKSQNALLKLMFDCVRNNEALTFEQLVYCYSENVNSKINWPWMDSTIHGVRIYGDHDVIESYRNQDYFWQYKIKGLIKSWFVSAIGLLVIKGYLKVVPNIDID